MIFRWAARLRALRPAWRDAFAGALGLALVSGWLLAPAFDAQAGLRSIATWLLVEPMHAWWRAVHAASAAVVVVAAVVRVLRPRGECEADRRWLAAMTWAACTGLAVLTGWLLRGDATTLAARGVLARLGVVPASATDLLGPAGLSFVHMALIPLTLVAAVVAGSTGERPRFAPSLTLGLLILAVAAFVQPGLSDVAPISGWPIAGRSIVRAGPALSADGPTSLARGAVVTVRGRPEGCFACHGAMAGFSPAHAPEKIGCAACHGGDAFAQEAAPAHRGLIRVPGNLTDAARTCGQTGCHADVEPRVARSLMTTFAGVIAVDRTVFGEPSPANKPADVKALTHSPADQHLRQLCASCHLGQPKTQWRANDDASRGGGCLACHLVYSEAAARELERYRSGTMPSVAPAVHPRLTVNPPDDNCFSCHSRSGRIATNYAGWREIGPTRGPGGHPEAARLLRTLSDGRTFADAEPDVHHERGMGCIDCHTAAETMGRGLVAQRKHQQQEVRCEDCHATRLPILEPTALPAEAAKIVALRGVRVTAGERFAVTHSGDPLVNVTVSPAGQPTLRRKADGTAVPIKPPAAACARGAGHERLSCGSCHTAWAPRCVSCHTEYKPKAEGFDHVAQQWVTGAWVETGGDFDAVPPTLGVRQLPGSADRGTIETFAPGMVLTIDGIGFRRLYARVAPHTTQRASRTCGSCHASPVALGYGEGDLTYRREGPGGTWTFAASRPTEADGLPADAWIGFLQTRTTGASTRDDVRPLSTAEQQRVLRVGACLTCHAGDSAPMQAALVDFAATFARRTAQCSTPW